MLFVLPFLLLLISEIRAFHADPPGYKAINLANATEMAQTIARQDPISTSILSKLKLPKKFAVGYELLKLEQPGIQALQTYYPKNLRDIIINTYTSNFQIKLSYDGLQYGGVDQTGGVLQASREFEYDRRSETTAYVNLHSPQDSLDNSRWVLQPVNSSGYFIICLARDSERYDKINMTSWCLDSERSLDNDKRNNDSSYIFVNKQLSSIWMLIPNDDDFSIMLANRDDELDSFNESGWYLCVFRGGNDVRDMYSTYAIVYSKKGQACSWKFNIVPK